jgi:hypothetical protein
MDRTRLDMMTIEKCFEVSAQRASRRHVTRHGGIIDQAAQPVAVGMDGIDADARRGWS